MTAVAPMKTDLWDGLPRQDTSWTAVLDEKLVEQQPLKDVISAIHEDPLEKQIDELEKLRAVQQERISMLHKSIKEKQAARQHKKAKEAEVKQFSKEEKEKIRAIFDRFDADNSGYIDEDEFKSMVEQLGVNVPERDIQGAIQSLSSDGKVSFDDFLKWWGSDSSRGGNKGIALAMARMKLRALGASSKLKEKMALENARAKAGIGVSIETDTTIKVGEMVAPRTQLNVRFSTYTEEEFNEIAAGKFKDAEKPMQPADSMIADEEDEEATPIVLAEATIELRRPADPKGEQDLIQCLKYLCELAASYCQVDGGWLWTRVIDTDLPTLTIQMAFAHTHMDKQILENLTGTASPDKDDLEKLINEVELDVHLGADLNTFMRRMLEDATSLFSIGDTGMTFKLKGRLAPSMFSVFSTFGSSGKDLIAKKVVELVASSLSGSYMELVLGDPVKVLEDAVDSFISKVSQQLPGMQEEAAQEELVKLRGALVFITTMTIEKRLTLSNTPLVDAVGSLMEIAESDRKDMGWKEGLMPPIEVLYHVARHVKEIKNVTAWTKYQKVDIAAQGLALFSGLPCDDSEVERFLTDRRVSRGFTENYSAVQVMKFPKLEEALGNLEEENILTSGLMSVIEAIKDLEDEDLTIPTPG
eukprot:TRINITY_DN1924_c0_g1_i2.p1 TRINITY_DN1924_c0_g1~~TRINITY_DN1924_c0_g1_i2.p1  ORF type:complete len:643 (+),score=271.64 TRINITY_DN1924_c0_g1_i2:263-2191(+)